VLQSTSQAGQVLQSTCQVVLVLQSTRQAGLVLQSTSQAGQVLQSTCQAVLVLQSTRKVGSGAAKHQKGGTWKGVQDTNPSWELVLRSILVQGPEQVPQMCT